MFNVRSIDELTGEQYTILILLWNKGVEESRTEVQKARNKFTTSIQTVKGRPDVNYGDD